MHIFSLRKELEEQEHRCRTRRPRTVLLLPLHPLYPHPILLQLPPLQPPPPLRVTMDHNQQQQQQQCIRGMKEARVRMEMRKIIEKEKAQKEERRKKELPGPLPTKLRRLQQEHE